MPTGNAPYRLSARDGVVIGDYQMVTTYPDSTAVPEYRFYKKVFEAMRLVARMYVQFHQEADGSHWTDYEVIPINPAFPESGFRGSGMVVESPEEAVKFLDNAAYAPEWMKREKRAAFKKRHQQKNIMGALND